MNAGTSEDKEYITLARIGRPRGVKGEFYLRPLAANYERFGELKKVYLAQRKHRVATEAESFRVISGKLVLKVKGIDSPEEVKAWTSGYLEIDPTDRVKLPEGEYFQDDVVGLVVVTEDGEGLGTVERVLSFPANDVYVCRTTDGGEVLIPAIEDVVIKIDLDGGEMIVQPLPGLFD